MGFNVNEFYAKKINNIFFAALLRHHTFVLFSSYEWSLKKNKEGSLKSLNSINSPKKNFEKKYPTKVTLYYPSAEYSQKDSKVGRKILQYAQVVKSIFDKHST